MQKKLKVIAGAGVAIIATGGTALAATTPDAAQDGLGRAEEVTGLELPASEESHATADDHPGGAPDTETIEVEADESELEVAPTDTHGATVSAVAQDDSTTGREHGEAVATVASENAAEPETPDQAATPGTVPEQADDAGVAGAAHAEGRGRP